MVYKPYTLIVGKVVMFLQIFHKLCSNVKLWDVDPQIFLIFSFDFKKY
jgi:hypothetical protein